MIKKGDPHYGVYEHVHQWHNTVECLPTWLELREMEEVRQSGKINMMSAGLARYLLDNEFACALCWYLRCREYNTHPASLYDVAIKNAEEEHGPRHTWFTEKMRTETERRIINLKMVKLQVELNKLRMLKKREIGSSGHVKWGYEED